MTLRFFACRGLYPNNQEESELVRDLPILGKSNGRLTTIHTKQN